jgi:protocatechuate 3,4-dioxygenase beta subunit
VAAQPSACPATPTETRGPFPADGTNGRPRISVLSNNAVLRDDIRTSFAGLSGRAEGVRLDLQLRLIGSAGCDPLARRAVYLWHNDAAGDYSLYDLPDANYLRGLAAADEAGAVRFTTIVPGCYGGRYPHCHLEVFESVPAALGGAAPLLVSQLAFPAPECRALYRQDGRYGASLGNLEQLPIERDFVFADATADGRSRQTVRFSGNPTTGYRGIATVTLEAGA